jgi:hypothetical protein
MNEIPDTPISGTDLCVSITKTCKGGVDGWPRDAFTRRGLKLEILELTQKVVEI